jgi:tetratricopeptide (TPR) repeat protein
METKTRANLLTLGNYVIALVMLFGCVYGAIASTQAGLSRLFSEYGSASESLEASERALGFSPQDPEAHYAHALRLGGAGRDQEAIREFEQAVLLRSRDYFLWQELARAREETDDRPGAIAALKQAIALAPEYAQLHWQLGNLLLRTERLDQGFAELRLASDSDALLYEAMIDLAWGLYEGDASSMLHVGQPRNNNERVSLASFLVNHERADTAMVLLRPTISILSAEDRASLTAALIATGKLSDAFEVWTAGAGIDATGEKIFDGGFEGTIDFNERGFGWKPTQATGTVRLLLDTNSPHAGQRSLRLDYSGGFDPGTAVISQLIIVAPHTRYRLSFSARAEDLKSAALPLVAVKDADGLNVQSLPLADTTGSWREFVLEFETANASVITINIQRQACSSNPCPIFGRAWFDSFSLKRQ